MHKSDQTDPTAQSGNDKMLSFPKFDKLSSKSPIHYYVGVLEYEHGQIGEQMLYAALLIHSLDNLVACTDDEVMNKVEGCIVADGNFRWLVDNDDFSWTVTVKYSVQSNKELEALRMMHHQEVDQVAYVMI